MSNEPVLTNLYKRLKNDELFRNAKLYHERHDILDSIDITMDGENFWIADEDIENNEIIIFHRPKDGEHTAMSEIVDINISMKDLYNIMLKLVDIPHRRKILNEPIKIRILDKTNEHDLGCLIEQLQEIYENRNGSIMTVKANIVIQSYRCENMDDYEKRIAIMEK